MKRSGVDVYSHACNFMQQHQPQNQGGKRLTYGLKLSQAKVRHAPKPKPPLRISRTVIAPQPLIVGIIEARNQLILTRLAIQHCDAVLDPEQDLVAGVDALNVRRDGWADIQLDRLERMHTL